MPMPMCICAYLRITICQDNLRNMHLLKQQKKLKSGIEVLAQQNELNTRTNFREEKPLTSSIEAAQQNIKAQVKP